MPTSLLDLRTAIRTRSNTTRTQVVTDAELNTIVNQYLLELYDLVVRMHPDNYVSSTDMVVGADGCIPIPSVLYKLRGVDLQFGSNIWRPLKRYMWAERYEPQLDFTYRELGTTALNPNGPVIQIAPFQLSPGKTIRIWYVPRPVEAVNDTDILDSILDTHREFIIAGAAATVFEIQEDLESAAPMRARKTEIENKLRASIPRDITHPERVQDTRSPRNPWPWVRTA